MTEALTFEIISPAKVALKGEAELIIVPGSEGDLGAVKGRMPITLMLRAGVVYIMNNDNVSQRIFVDDGYAQIEAERLCILCENSLDFDDITADEIGSRLEKAEKNYNEAKDDNKAEAEKALNIAKALSYCYNNPSYR